MTRSARDLEAPPHVIRDLVSRTLAEDIGPGDATSQAVIPPSVRATGQFIAKQAGIMAGMAVARECFMQLGPDIDFTMLKQAGEDFTNGEVVAEVEGPARALLAAERAALNFVQRLCGVATLTRRFVDAVADTNVQIVDTRKTTPGVRALDRAAVRAGGGKNHRLALYDGILIKDNHLRLAGGVAAAVAAAHAHAHSLFKIEVETTNLDQVQEALAAGADIIMLDNMSIGMMREAVEIIGDQALVEASGGIDLSNVAEVAAIGVNMISVGTLTHSAPSLDISLELQLSP